MATETVNVVVDVFNDTDNGFAPASGGGTSNFLRADGTWAVPPGSGILTIPTGNTLWVDAVNGNDGTAVVERQDKPYLTLSAAKTAASSGDLIRVRPGTYDERDLLKDGVNWYFEAGASVVYTGSDPGAIFDDTATGSAGPVDCAIAGDGVFVYSGAIDDAESASAIYLNSVSTVVMRCKSIGHTVSNDLAATVYCSDAALKLECSDSITADDATVIWWKKGECYISAPYILGGGDGAPGIYATSGENANSNLWINADLIEDNPNALGVLVNGPEDNTSKTWIDVKEIRSNIVGAGAPAGAVNLSTGKVYITADKISAPTSSSEVINVTDAQVWINVQKVTTGTGPAIFMPDTATGSGYIEILHVEADACTTDAIDVEAGLRMNITEIVTGAAANGVSGHSFILSGCRISGPGAGKNPVVLTLDSPSTTLDGCKLIADAGEDSITAPSAMTIVAYNSSTNTAVNANVTVTGDLFYDQGGPNEDDVATANADGTWSWAAAASGGITELTGGVTAGPGSGSVVATVVTNANLTGPVTSVGNATAIADGALSIAKTSGLQTALDLKAPLASPALTGTPTVPTAAAGTNTTQAASTAFVQDEFSARMLAAALTSTQTTSSASYIDVTGVAVTIPAGQVWLVDITGAYTSTNTSTGVGFSLTVTGTPLSRTFDRRMFTTATTATDSIVQVDDGGVASATVDVADARRPFNMVGVVKSDASPCVVQLRVIRAGSANNITVVEGTCIRATRIA